MLQDAIQRLGNELHDQVEEEFIPACGREEAMLQTNNIAMVH
jgi:hypothetical protein